LVTVTSVGDGDGVGDDDGDGDGAKNGLSDRARWCHTNKYK